MHGWFWILIYKCGSLDTLMNGCCHLMVFIRTWLALIIRGDCQARSKSKQAVRRAYARTYLWSWLRKRGTVTPSLLSCDKVGCRRVVVILGAFCPFNNRVHFQSVKVVGVSQFFHHKQNHVPSLKGLRLIWRCVLVGLVLVPAEEGSTVFWCSRPTERRGFIWILRNVWGLVRRRMKCSK